MLSSLRQVTLHQFRSKTKRNKQASIFKAERDIGIQEKKEDAKTISEAVTQAAIETMKAVVQAITLAGDEVRSQPFSTGPKLRRPTLKQPTFTEVPQICST